MRPIPSRRRLHVWLCLTVVTAALVWGAGTIPDDAGALEPESDLGCADSLVEKTLPSGTAWRMCARVHPIKGLLLEKVEVKPASSREYVGYKRVIDELYLAQLNVPYDNGASAYNDITSYGFGGRYLLEQSPEVCHGEARTVHQAYYIGQTLVERSLPGICVDTVAAGLAAHSQDSIRASDERIAEQGSGLQVSSLSKIGWYEYQQKVTFNDHGQIDVALGATGDLAPGAAGSYYYSEDPGAGWPVGPPINGQDYYAASHWHSAIYRVDFGIDQGERQFVEQWDYATRQAAWGQQLAGAGTRRVRAFSAVPGAGNDRLSWWRVLNPDSLNRDGHPRSYEIVNQNVPNELVPVTQPLVSFTNANECQEYASENLNPSCAGESVLDYVAGDERELTDPVAWVNVGYHHVVRDEEQSPMPIHWQGFQLVPRDFFAQSPTLGDARSCVNGAPGGSASAGRPCIATNIVPPKITSSAVEIKAGTELEASPGVWDTSRTDWNYAYLWFRDGKPIQRMIDGVPVPITGEFYVVTAADQGALLTVKVTASQAGYPSGTAESLPLQVAGVRPRPPAEPAATTTHLRFMKATIRRGDRPVAVVTVRAGRADVRGRVEVRFRGRVLGRGTLNASGQVRVKLQRWTRSQRGAVRTYRLRAVYVGSPEAKASRSGVARLRVRR